MDNNWIVAVFVALVSLFNILFAAPTATSTLQDEDNGIMEYYDQRQNGTENIRIDLNGVVIVVSPLEALLTAASLFDSSLFQENFDDGIDFFKKQNKQNFTDTKISERPVVTKHDRNNIRTSTEKTSRKKG